MGTIVLDASVILGLFDDADAHHHAAEIAVRAHHEAGDNFLVPASVAAEVLVGACRQRSEEQRLRQLHSTFGPLRPIDADVALVAARLRAKHRALRLPDALVLAVAHVDAADVILTADRKWSGYDQRVRLI